MGVNGVKAAGVLRGYSNLMHGYCLYYVWQAYKAVGASTGMSAGTALEAWYKSNGKHPGDRNPPAGVPVFWGAKPGSSAGDVVISLGNGRVIATDYPRYGVVGECTIDERERQIGRPYLGWTESIFDQAIDFDRGSSGGSSGGDGSWPARKLYGEGWVKEIQRKLVRMNHPLAIDGKDGPATQEVVRFEQSMSAKHGFRINGRTIAVDGIAGPEFNAFLDWWLSGHPAQGVSPKKHWELTFADIQTALNRKGYGLVVDNIWGPASSDALADFQRKNGLVVDRIVGEKTWALLNS